MARGILYVEYEPDAAEAAAYHEWYDGTHMAEMLGIDGLVSARRFAPLDGEGPFVAVYEIEADDVAAVEARLAEATRSGRFSAPVGLRRDKPPTLRFYREISTHTA